MSNLGRFDVSQVGGNASEEIKRLLGDPEAFFNSFQKPEQIPSNTFGRDVGRRMTVTEISILKKKEEPEKLEGRVVMEIEVQEGASTRTLRHEKIYIEVTLQIW